MIPVHGIPITPERWKTYQAVVAGCTTIQEVADYSGIPKMTARDRLYSAKAIGFVRMEHRKAGTIRPGMRIVRVIE